MSTPPPPWSRDDATYIPFRDDMYRAIGRYVVEFSRIFTLMRNKMAYRLSQAKPGESYAALEVAFGEMTASQLTNAYFATCLEVAQLSGEERKIGRTLRAMVISETERRNDIAHGDWHVAQIINVEPRRNHAELRRLKPAKDLGVHDTQDFVSKTLDDWADEVNRLGLMVATFGQITLGIWPDRRVSDSFRREKKSIILID